MYLFKSKKRMSPNLQFSGIYFLFVCVIKSQQIAACLFEMQKCTYKTKKKKNKVVDNNKLHIIRSPQNNKNLRLVLKEDFDCKLTILSGDQLFYVS